MFSFPPKSALGPLTSFLVQVEAPSLYLSARALELAICESLRSSGLELRQAQESCDAVLVCEVRQIVTLRTDEGPIALAFSVNMKLLTAVVGYPQSELFCVWSSHYLGSATPSLIADLSVKAAEACAKGFVEDLRRPSERP